MMASDLVDRFSVKDLTIEHSCGCKFGYEHFPIIILAAQAGLNESIKASIIRRIAKTASPNALILLRASSGMRRLLYPGIPREYLAGFEVLEEESPEKDFISHLMVLRKCA